MTEVATAGWTICTLGRHFGNDTSLCVQKKKREELPVMHSFIHISLILFFFSLHFVASLMCPSLSACPS